MLEGWNEFLLGTAGAAGALAGLIMVAVSVSVDRMIAIPAMTSRAASAIAQLVFVTIAGLAGLMPGLGDVGFALVVIGVGLGATWFGVDALLRLLASEPSRSTAALKGVLPLIPMALCLIGAVLVLLRVVTGPELIAFGMLGALCFAVISAWVVLVEIRR